MAAVEKIKLKSFRDERGVLVPLELGDHFDWEIKRIYYLTDVVLPRGGHAVKGERKIYVCQKGSVKAKFHDGKGWKEFELAGPDEAVLMNEMCFREFYDFSEDCVLLAISSVKYVPEDYIYVLEEFIKYKNQSEIDS